MAIGIILYNNEFTFCTKVRNKLRLMIRAHHLWKTHYLLQFIIYNLLIMFQKGDIVWMKTQKYPVWPGVIKRGRQLAGDGKYYYEATFISDNSGITIDEGSLSKFDSSRVEFLPSESSLKKYKNLSKALVEAEKRVQYKSQTQSQSQSKSQIKVGNQSKNKNQNNNQSNNQSLNKNKNEQLIKKQIETSKSKGSEKVFSKRQSQESRNVSKSKVSRDSKEKPQISFRKQSARIVQNQSKNHNVNKRQREDQQLVEKEQKQRLEKQRQKQNKQKEKQKEKQKQKEKEKQRQRQRQRQRERQRQRQRQKQKQIEKEKEKHKERQKQKELQKQRQKFRQKQRSKELVPPQQMRTLRAQIPKISPLAEKTQDMKISIEPLSGIKQKQLQKQQLRQLFTIKSLSRSTNTNSYAENGKLQYFQFRLESLMFILLDNSRTPQHNKKIEDQFQMIEELFDISQVQLKSFANSKICSILTLFLEKQSSKFSKRQLSWIQNTLDLINNRIISQLNDYSCLQSYNRFQEQQSIMTLQQQSANNQQVLRRQYRDEIIDTLKNKISEINERIFQVITQEILTFLQERTQRVEEGWQSLKKLINSTIYVTCDECFRKVNEYMQSIGPT